MEKNNYQKILLTLLLLSSIFFGYSLITATDVLRERVESNVEQLRRIENKIDILESNVSNWPKLSLKGIVQRTKTDNSENNDNTQFANKCFYPNDASSGGSIIRAIASETKNMNYLVNNEAGIGDIWDLTFDQLAERNYEKPEIFEPQLAESWELSKDKMTYTIKLRQGILWHDFQDPVNGKEWRNVEVTSSDFKFYVDVIKNQKTDCAPSRVYLKDLDRIEIISKYMFKVHWQKKYFLSESITLGLRPLPKHLYHAYDGPFDGEKFNDDHERNRLIVGCGPYRFDKWEKAQRIVLRRWEKYYGRRYGVNPALERIAYEVIDHPNTRLQSLISTAPGTADMVKLEPEQWVRNTSVQAFDKKNGHLRKLKHLSRAYYYIGYNLNKKIFDNRLTRLGLTHLVDRQRILKEVYYGLGEIVSGNFFINSPYYDKSIEPWPFSIETGMTLLKEAGWKDSDDDGILDMNGKKLEFSVLSRTNGPTYDKILQIVKEDMSKAGVLMRIQKVEWSVMTQRLSKKAFEACILGWRLGFESDPYQIWHSSQANSNDTSNHIAFRNPQADRLIESIRVCFDLKKRIKLCHEFHQLLHKEQPYTFLLAPDALFGLERRYKNVRTFPDGIPLRILWVPKTEQQK